MPSEEQSIISLPLISRKQANTNEEFTREYYKKDKKKDKEKNKIID
jgi:hypothetical protein